ncbi:MAG: PaaI family thioesterase [Phenylobacterium sp.]|jgi:uncharacterized protein (TIGR00369 family)|uniref:PaaI family thioesterase n=1 Tax=Phenylobacterium sp. TaxID=1871053 RepID=UPI0025CD7935|nr:PaaI family thioesterase [Phenylobacterium sp.]MCA3458363.1 PaaI family thioesterase [Rhodobacter sp.]MCA3643159.1 PaaI family thioesterase [Methylobacterium sp.]MCA3737921.1 PaaI family thioesterase [Phenylobacterium sp.]MCA3755369.1 PaaI family thioesterase [Phenylobacterium sp.]MCA6255578.1 PaaI family thioesterase [Phenylobacterium sp.]
MTPSIFDSLGDKPKMAEMVGWEFIANDKDARTVSLSFVASELFSNPMGYVHGGFLSTMLDETMGSALVATTDAEFFGTTISMTTDFCRPAFCGKIFAEGRVTTMGKSVAFLEGTLTDDKGKLIARSTASYKLHPFVRPEKKTAASAAEAVDA